MRSKVYFLCFHLLQVTQCETVLEKGHPEPSAHIIHTREVSLCVTIGVRVHYWLLSLCGEKTTGVLVAPVLVD